MSVTIEEIKGQPKLWIEISRLIQSRASEISEFFKTVDPNAEVIFSGAGSSAFVGETVAGIFQRETDYSTRAVATTDIVTHPELYLNRSKPLLFISLARSGNSPESLASIETVERFHPEARHLIITCNAQGKLAQLGTSERRFVLLLPEKANDQGLAMIGSVTGMTLAAILVSRIDKIDTELVQVQVAARYGETVLRHEALIRNLAQLEFRRVVCLGSGPLLGLAREAHLKIQELSDGQVIGKFDSYLGFRHGPKAVVDNQTLLIYFIGSDSHINEYERDLIASVEAEQKPLFTLGISERPCKWRMDHEISMNDARDLNPDYLALPFLLPVQLLAAFKSQSLGLNPDSPSKVIHRVVQGVKIYPREIQA